MKTLAGFLSGLVILVSVLAALGLVLAPSGGGFFPGLGMALALMVLGAGNLLSFLLDLACWWLGMRRRWFGVLILLQAVPAILFAVFVATEL